MGSFSPCMLPKGNVVLRTTERKSFFIRHHNLLKVWRRQLLDLLSHFRVEHFGRGNRVIISAIVVLSVLYGLCR